MFRVWFGLLIFTFCSQVFSNPAYDTKLPYRILAIYSYNRSNEIRNQVSYGLLRSLDGSGITYALDTIELNTIFEKDPARWNEVVQGYIPEIKQGKYDLIVLAGDEAMQTIKKSVPQIPPETSLFFINVVDWDESILKIHPNGTVLKRREDPLPNIKIGLNLFPKTQDVYILTHERLWNNAQFEEVKNTIPDNIRIHILSFDDTAETLAKIGQTLVQAPPNSFLISMGWVRYSPSKSVREQDLKWLKSHYNGPIFVRRGSLTNDTLGGAVSSFKMLGDAAGNTVLKIVTGTSAGDIAPADAPIQLLFNDIELKRFGITHKMLPPDAIIINAPIPWTTQYADFIYWCGVTLAIIVLGLGFGIIMLALSRKKMKISALVHKALPVRVAVFDEKGNVLFFHKEYEYNEPMPTEKYATVHDLPWIKGSSALEMIHSAFATGKTKTISYNFFGSKRLATFSKIDRSIFGRDAVIAVSSDAMELEAAKEKALSSAKHLSQTLRAIGDAVITTDENEIISMLNPVAERLTGYSSKEAVGKKLDDVFNIVSYVDDRPVPSPVRSALRSGKIVTLANHTDLVAKNGLRRHIADSAAPIFNESGHTTGAILVFRDVTGEYEKRDTLAFSQFLLNTLTKYAQMSFFRLDIDTEKISPVLPGGSLRFVPDFGNGHIALAEWLEPESYENFHAKLEMLKSGKTNNFHLSFKVNNNGRTQYFTCHGGLVADTMHKNNGREIVGVCQDITDASNERKQIDINIRLLQIVMEAIPYPIFIKDTADDFRYLRCNLAFASQFGLSETEVQGKTDFQLMRTPADAENLRKHDLTVLKTGGSTEFEESYNIVDGFHYKCRTIKTILHPQDGTPLLIGISIDQSNIELSREKAVSSQNILRAILNELPAVITVRDLTQNDTYLVRNKMAQDCSPLRNPPLPGDYSLKYRSMLPDTFQPLVADADEVRNNPTLERQVEIDSADGKKLTINYLHRLIQVNGKELLLTLGLNITERTRIQKELNNLHLFWKAKEERFNLFINNIKRLREVENYSDISTAVLSSYAKLLEADRSSVFAFRNGVFYKKHEWSADGFYSLEEYTDQELGFLTKIFKNKPIQLVEDSITQPLELQTIKTMMNAENIRAIALVGIFDQDELKGLMDFEFVRGSHKFNEDDLAIIQDALELIELILAGKKYNKTIDRQKMLRSKIVEMLNFPISLFDRNGVFLEANESFFRFWNCTKEQAVGKVCYKSCPLANEDFCNEENCPLLAVQKNGQPAEKTIWNISQTILSKAIPITDENNELEYIIQSSQDISDISQEKQQLEEYLKQDELIRDCLNMLVASSGQENILQRIVSKVSAFYNNTPCIVMQLFKYPSGNRFRRIAWEMPQWCPQEFIDSCMEIPVEKYPALYETIRNGKMLRYDVGSIPSNQRNAWQNELESYLRHTGNRAIQVVPILCFENLWGYFAVEVKDSKIAKTDERIFTHAAQMIQAFAEKNVLLSRVDDERELHAKIFENIEVAIAMFDAERKIVAMNRSFRELLYHDNANIIGSPCYDGYCKSKNTSLCSSEKCPVYYTAQYSMPRELIFEQDNKTLNGRTQPIFDTQGKLAYIIESVIDITDAKNREEKLIKQREELQQFNTQLNLFVEHDKLLSECLELMLFDPDSPETIERVLGMIGKTLKADNCALMQYSPNTEEPGSEIKIIWSNPDCEYKPPVGAKFHEKDFSAVFTLLKTGQTVHGRDEDMQESTAWEKEYKNYFDQTGKRELIKVPLIITNNFWGYIGVEHSSSVPFPSVSIRLIENTAHIFSVLLERNQRQQNIQQIEKEKTVILDSLDFPLVVLDIDLTIRHANAAAKSIMRKLNVSENITCVCDYCTLPCNRQNPLPECIINRTLKTAVPQSSIRSLAARTYLQNTLPVINNGKIVRILLSMTDVSSLDQKQKKLEQALEQANKMLKEKDFFIENAGQRIFSSLNVTMNNLEQSKSEDNNNQITHSHWEKAVQTGQTILCMVNAFMEFAALDSKSVPVVKTELNFNNFLSELKNEYNIKVQNHELKFSFDSSGEIPKFINLDSKRLKRILNILLDNAIDHTSVGGIGISVQRTSDNYLQIAVKDTGIGIATEDLSKILKPFANTAEQVGTHCGIGVCLAAKLAEQMEGKLEINSVKDKGSCFMLHIPCHTISLTSSLSSPVNYHIQSLPQGSKILVVDDVQMNLKVMSAMLRKTKCIAKCAISAEEALTLLKNESFDFILTDIWMPEMNGVEMANTIRNHPEWADLPIIAITADAESHRSFDLSCFDDVLIKPLTLEKLQNIKIRTRK